MTFFCKMIFKYAQTVMKQSIWRLFLMGLGIVLAGCGLFETGQGVVATITPSSTPAGTPIVIVPPPLETIVPAGQQPITLTLWTTADISPRSELPGGSALLELLNNFDNNNPTIHLYIELKTITDAGGSLNYLRTGRDVAPTILPDLILLPTNQLAVAAGDGLIFPLDSLLTPEAISDLYPVADSLSRVDDFMYGYPFAIANLQHLVLAAGQPPATWPTLFSQSEQSFIFPVASPVGAEMVLQFYLAAGGSLGSANQPTLQVEPLVQALEQINLATTNGAIDPATANLTSLEQSWQRLASSPAGIAQSTANQFLSQQPAGAAYLYAPLPTPFTPLVTGWSWAISTPDPTRQKVAADLLNWLAESQHLATWSQQGFFIPSRQSALAAWTIDQGYINFLQAELQRARPYPAGATPTILSALSNAAADVILQIATPQQAAEIALTTIQP